MTTQYGALTGTTLKTILFGTALAALAISAEGCAGAADKLGLNSQAPDEFRVVSKAPLVVPPDYALRPPTPGQPRPQELQPESQARLALVGQQEAVQRSQGETLLVSRAGAQKADPLIRYVMDDEFGDIAHKDKSFADTVMFWKKGAPAPVSPAQAAGANTPAPLDPVAEQRKIKSLTGGKPIVIARAPEKKGFKLPGL
jgi:hypothetical protein